MIKSEYLCECGELLYLDIKTKKEYCLNPSCDNYQKVLILNNSIEVEKKLREDLDNLKRRIILLSNEFKDFLLKYREILFFNLDKGMKIAEFHAINELLMICSEINCVGRVNNEKKFKQIVTEFFKISDTLNFVDSIKEKIYILVKINNSEKLIVLQMKYYFTFIEQYDNYGLVNISRKNEIFKFEEIDRSKIEEINFKVGMELTDYFKQFFRVMIQMKLLLSFNHRLSLISRRSFSKKDVAGLLSIFFSCKWKKLIWSPRDLENHLRRNEIVDMKKIKFKEFLFDNKKIPLGMMVGNKYIFYPLTLLFFSLFFMGSLNEKNLVNEMKRQASKVFESEIRKKLRSKGLLIPFDEEIKLLKKGLSYDVIAVSEKDKKIYLIEVKYWDMPPSGFSGKNILNIKLKGKDADSNEILMAQEQEKREDEFKQNLRQFEKKSNLNVDDYKVYSAIVLKYTSFIKSYNRIKFYSFEEIRNMNF